MLGRHESVIAGLMTALAAHPVPVSRQDELPRTCPPDGILNIVPQDPVETGFRLGTGRREWQRPVDLEMVVQGATNAERTVAIDALAGVVGALLTGSNLDGLVDYIDMSAPQQSSDVPMEGAESLLGSVIVITLFYETSINPMEIQT
ncbi:hypothetical protein GGR95_002961 [Sulfitobacter undariae]|uniref:Uncharacterized protein n=1 Tax=Sulfitobacter undariae TaxID=1563671 RepID=A0A7W6E897_9RHOB|nr:hypothetical protein [Sulfitobacter undariae]MBB3995306.1 hypothetical protein [Sulfitobacter undariae]